jgi:hypothetical protein
MLPVAVYLCSTSVRDKFTRVKTVVYIKDGRTSSPPRMCRKSAAVLVPG